MAKDPVSCARFRAGRCATVAAAMTGPMMERQVIYSRKTGAMRLLTGAALGVTVLYGTPALVSPVAAQTQDAAKAPPAVAAPAASTPTVEAESDRALAAINAISNAEWSRGDGKVLVSRVIEASSGTSLNALAARGDARAQFLAGLAYSGGLNGFPENKPEAVRLYKLAADQSYAAAQTVLGLMQVYGSNGLPKDPAEGVRLITLAADQGLAEAQHNLGALYYKGHGGLPRNYAKAAELFTLAADQGSAAAQNALGVMYQEDLGGPDATKLMVHYYKLAADQGYAPGQVALGALYLDGRRDLPKNPAEAERWLRLAADQGYAPAWYELGLAYLYGKRGLRRNKAEGELLLKLAADQGNEDAKAALQSRAPKAKRKDARRFFRELAKP